MPVEFIRRTSGNGKIVGILHSRNGLLNKNLWGKEELNFSKLDPFYVVIMDKNTSEWLPDEIIDYKFPQWNDEKYMELNSVTISKDEPRLSVKMEKVMEASKRFRESTKSIIPCRNWLEAQNIYIEKAKLECGKEVQLLMLGKGSKIDLGDDVE